MQRLRLFFSNLGTVETLLPFLVVIVINHFLCLTVFVQIPSRVVAAAVHRWRLLYIMYGGTRFVCAKRIDSILVQKPVLTLQVSTQSERVLTYSQPRWTKWA